jgi:hypothetical protein
LDRFSFDLNRDGELALGDLFVNMVIADWLGAV